MLSTVRAFLSACDAENIHYRAPRELESGKTDVTIEAEGTGGERYEVRFIFDANERSAAVRVYGIVKVTKERFAKVLLTCNKLNDTYRWVKFDIDDDMDLNIECDCILSERTAAVVCREMFYQVTTIAAKAYPELMKAVWG